MDLRVLGRKLPWLQLSLAVHGLAAFLCWTVTTHWRPLYAADHYACEVTLPAYELLPELQEDEDTLQEAELPSASEQPAETPPDASDPNAPAPEPSSETGESGGAPGGTGEATASVDAAAEPPGGTTTDHAHAWARIAFGPTCTDCGDPRTFLRFCRHNGCARHAVHRHRCAKAK